MSQQETKDMAKHFYRASAADFMKIPSSPIAYWVPNFSIFKYKNVSSDWVSGGRIKTHDGQKYIRLNWEVSRDNSRWRRLIKGGDFRKHFGNEDFLVDWSDEAINFYERNGGLYPERFRSKEGICWSKITSALQSFRIKRAVTEYDSASPTIFNDEFTCDYYLLGLLNSKVSQFLLKAINPTLNTQVADVMAIPVCNLDENERELIKASQKRLVEIAEVDWNAYETSWEYMRFPLINKNSKQTTTSSSFMEVREYWDHITREVQSLEERNNSLFIAGYGFKGEVEPSVPLDEVTLTCNPHYRYPGNRREEDLETLLQCDTIRELISYAIGCMMGRYSLDNPGLILASQGETLQDYLRQTPSPSFAPDDDAILPLTDQEWFPDDATNRFCEFVRVVWGDEHLQENLDFVAESLCLHAIKPKRGESALDTIRRYLSTQFYKDHMRTYKKRPIYWLFSSGKHKAFECLVYLHRYNEGTLARMRTEYVIPLSAKLSAYAEKLEQDKDASSSAAETKRLEKEIATLHKQQTELAEFDEKLRHYADQRISLDLDDGVKVNYGKFGDLLAEVKAVHG